MAWGVQGGLKLGYLSSHLLVAVAAGPGFREDPGAMSNHDWSIPHVGAHQHSANHRAEIESSDRCGCFYCLAVFGPANISDWIDEVEGLDSGTTALCPRCGIDSVIGSASGYPIEKAFLEQMKGYWF